MCLYIHDQEYEWQKFQDYGKFVSDLGERNDI
jgi:hypothetical protein